MATFQRTPIPTLQNRWNAPPPSDQGAPTAEDVFLSVGRALSAWEQGEMMLAKLFGLLVEGDTDAAERAYGTLPGSRGRKDMILEAGVIYTQRHGHAFPMDELRLLMSHYDSASGRRSDIAHGMVMGINTGDVQRGFFLVPAVYRSQKNEPKTLDFWMKVQAQQAENPFAVFGFRYRYTHTDIHRFADLFGEFFQQVQGLYFAEFMRRTQVRFEEIPPSQRLTFSLDPDTQAPSGG